MSGFSADWLALREPADAAARSAALCADIRAALRCAQPGEAPAPADIVDLGAGTGSNLRYLAPRLGGTQRWRLIDDDKTVLAAVGPALRDWAALLGRVPADENSRVSAEHFRLAGEGFECEVECLEADLAADVGRCVMPERGLVTASALLDLVSAEWLEALAEQCASAEAAVLFALTYDGRIGFDPPEPVDQRVRTLVNSHQLRDKGFGPALGPGASSAALSVFAARGYTVRSERSDWRLEPESRQLQTALLEGWLEAATEIEPDERRRLEEWRRRRMEHVAGGRSRLIVGHRDLVGRLGSR